MSIGALIVLVLVVALTGVVIWRRQHALAVAGRSATYLKDVRAEVRRISWPAWDDLRKSTIVIILFVIAIGVVIGLMDWVFSKLLIDFLGRAFA